jgi:hypothetical protein
MQTRRLVNATFRSARLALLLSAGLWGQAAYGGPMPPSGIDQPVLVNGEEIGFFDIRVVTDNDGDQGLVGTFQVTKQNPDKTRMTFQKLYASLGIDHLNWFQKVTSDTSPPLDSRGNRLKAPYIDPPAGGYSDLWSDELPWYLDEQAPSKDELGGREWSPQFLLENNINETFGLLRYFDKPQGKRGNQISFATFLVGVRSDGTYVPLSGFSWGVEFGGGGLPGDTTYVSSSNKNAPFLAEYATEIYDDFGWTQATPEPSSSLLLVIGFAGMGPFAARRSATGVRNKILKDKAGIAFAK